MTGSTKPPNIPAKLPPEEMPDGESPARNEAAATCGSPEVSKLARNNEEQKSAEAQEIADPHAGLAVQTAPIVRNDSFNVPVKKNVIMIWALLNVGLVTFMAIMFYVLYQSQQN